MTATHRPYLGDWDRDEVGEWERESGLIAVYEAAPRPYWTQETPTHPGIWWVRRPGHDGRVVQVFEQHGRFFFEWSDIQTQQVVRGELEWGSRAIQEPR